MSPSPSKKNLPNVQKEGRGVKGVLNKKKTVRLAKKDIPYCSLDYFLVQSDENFLKMGGGGGEVLFFINEKFRL